MPSSGAASSPPRFRWWHPGFCLVFGLVPLLVLGAIEFYPRHSAKLQSALELYRVVVVLTSAITLPYLVFYAFILLALRNPIYRERFANAFGVTTLTPEPAVKAEPLPYQSSAAGQTSDAAKSKATTAIGQ